jgi:hypothetical protein
MFRECDCSLGFSSSLALEKEVARRVATEEVSNGSSVDRGKRQLLAKKLWREIGAVDEDRIRLEFIHVARSIGLVGHSAPKIFRHQFATALQEGRVDPLVRNLLMGHATAGERTEGHGLGMTAVYTHATGDSTGSIVLGAVATGRPQCCSSQIGIELNRLRNV